MLDTHFIQILHNIAWLHEHNATWVPCMCLPLIWLHEFCLKTNINYKEITVCMCMKNIFSGLIICLCYMCCDQIHFVILKTVGKLVPAHDTSQSPATNDHIRGHYPDRSWRTGFFNWSPCWSLAWPISSLSMSRVLHTSCMRGLRGQLLANIYEVRL